MVKIRCPRTHLLESVGIHSSRSCSARTSLSTCRTVTFTTLITKEWICQSVKWASRDSNYRASWDTWSLRELFLVYNVSPARQANLNTQRHTVPVKRRHQTSSCDSIFRFWRSQQTPCDRSTNVEDRRTSKHVVSSVSETISSKKRGSWVSERAIQKERNETHSRATRAKEN